MWTKSMYSRMKHVRFFNPPINHKILEEKFVRGLLTLQIRAKPCSKHGFWVLSMSAILTCLSRAFLVVVSSLSHCSSCQRLNNDLGPEEGGKGGPRFPLCEILCEVLSLLLLHVTTSTPWADRQVSISLWKHVHTSGHTSVPHRARYAMRIISMISKISEPLLEWGLTKYGTCFYN